MSRVYYEVIRSMLFLIMTIGIINTMHRRYTVTVIRANRSAINSKR